MEMIERARVLLDQLIEAQPVHTNGRYYRICCFCENPVKNHTAECLITKAALWIAEYEGWKPPKEENTP